MSGKTKKTTKKQTNGRLIEKEDEYSLPLTHSNLTAQDVQRAARVL